MEVLLLYPYCTQVRVGLLLYFYCTKVKEGLLLYPYCTQVREGFSSTPTVTRKEKKIFRRNLAENLCRSGSRSRRLQKSGWDPQTAFNHCLSYTPFQALSVSVNGESVGTVRERATWWNPVYHIFDSVGNQVFKIR
jgi:hypothetical protein